MKLIYNQSQNMGVIHNGTQGWPLIAPPTLSFPFESLFYCTDQQSYLHMRSGGQENLNEDEKAEIAQWIGLQEPPAESGPNPVDVQAELMQAVQEHLDNTARTRNYDGILSLCSYATSSNETFAAEGQAGVEWRDAVWAYCYQVLADVQAQLRQIPTPEQLVSELPSIVW